MNVGNKLTTHIITEFYNFDVSLYKNEHQIINKCYYTVYFRHPTRSSGYLSVMRIGNKHLPTLAVGMKCCNLTSRSSSVSLDITR